MKGFTKFLIAGAIFIVFGIIILIIGLSIGGWTVNPEFTEQTYVQSSENIESISLNFAAGEFEAVFYDGDKIEIEYYTSKVKDVTVQESGTTLSYRERNRFWISFGTVKYPKVTIKLPQDNVYNLKVDMSAGLITIAGGTYGDLDLNMSAGTVKLDGDIACRKLDIDASAGKINADNIECTSLKIDMSAGKVDIAKITCPTINIDISAGSVDLGVNGVKTEYTIKVDKSAGSCNVQNQTGTDAAKRIDVDISAGSVNVSFTN